MQRLGLQLVQELGPSAEPQSLPQQLHRRGHLTPRLGGVLAPLQQGAQRGNRLLQVRVEKLQKEEREKWLWYHGDALERELQLQ